MAGINLQNTSIRSRLSAAGAVLCALTLPGCMGIGDREDATQARESTTRRFSKFLEVSNAQRTSGEGTFVRLKALFPTQVNGQINYESIPDTYDIGYYSFRNRLNAFSAKSMDRSIAAPIRSTSVEAQFSMRSMLGPLCAAVATSTLLSTNGILLQGESLPGDAAVRKALAAARNGWLYPYAIGSSEVAVLADAYRAALATQGSSEAKADEALCMTVVTAPQFWLGNPGPDDAVRRVALELGRRVPTMAEYDAVRRGSLTLEGYVERLQGEDGYFQAVASWHQEWLGLRPFSMVRKGPLIDPRSNSGGFSANYGGGGFDPKPGASFNFGYHSVLRGDYVRFGFTGQASLSESCNYATAFEQPFDPRTTALIWEHKNPVNGAWEEIGRWTRNSNGTWTATGGQITLQGGAKKAVDLRDITYAMPELNADPTLQRYCYLFGKLKGTPLECFTERPTRSPGDDSWSFFRAPQHDRRVRRMTPSGEQNGYSKVKLWWGNSEVYACNSLTRMWATCALRTHSEHFVGGDYGKWNAYTGGGTEGNVTNGIGISTLFPPLNGSGASPAIDIQAVFRRLRELQDTPSLWPTLRDFTYRALFPGIHHSGPHQQAMGNSLANPYILEQLRCGVPNVTEIEKLGGSGYNEDAAFPKGYADADYGNTSVNVSQLPLSTLASSPAVGHYWHYFGEVPPPGVDINTTSPYAAPSAEYVQALMRMDEDISLEPYRLLKHVLRNGLDYRQMIQADYTFGREEFELAYRTQLWFLPAYPPGYSPTAPTSTQRRTVRMLREADIAPIPLSWGASRYKSIGAYDNEGGFRLYSGGPDTVAEHTYLYGSGPWTQNFVAPYRRSTGRIPPKRMSGILTMPAFIGIITGEGGTLRTVASRYYRRLLCGSESSVDLTSAERALHEPFIPGSRNRADNPHLDPARGCYACHVNLDPLAAALSKSFMSNPDDSDRGAIGEMVSTTLYTGFGWSDELSDGAFLGKPARGVKEVAQILGDSRDFARCVVTKAFENVFGRSPGLTDIELIGRATRNFTGTHRYNYNQMVRELASSAEFQREL